MLNRTVRYALRTLGYLAEHPGRRIRVERIAEATGIPANYTSKILNRLRREGIVDSEKGWGGGFTLRPEAARLPIGRVQAILDGAGTGGPRECVFGLQQCDARHPCPLHPQWERIQDTLAGMMDDTTIGDLSRRGTERSNPAASRAKAPCRGTR